ncbi:MAG: hypothetical protein M0R37_15280 [Bacteroidales bacterium]|jgi:hypothetical protein|nr:hypothetical protein [Bacteroidales bacterium]
MDSDLWLTDTARAALDAITDANGQWGSLDARKRRHTVQRLAWALASGEVCTDDEFFVREKSIPSGDPRRDKLLTARSTWWKVRDLPDVKAAREACLAAAQAWRDGELQREQTAAQRRVLLALAKNAETAIVDGLMELIQDANVRGDYRLQSIDRYTQLFSPEMAERIPASGSQALAVDVVNMPSADDLMKARADVLAWEQERFGDDGDDVESDG